MTRTSSFSPADAAIAAFALSALALGHALQINNGFYSDQALRWLSGSIACGLAGTLCLRLRDGRSESVHVVVALVLIGGIAWQIRALFTAAPGIYLDSRASLPLFKAGVAAEALLIGAGVSGRRIARHWFGAVLGIHAALGVWMIRASPNPWIDVVTVHRAAIHALLTHHDPYRITIQNIYGDLAPFFYNRAAIIGNYIALGYPYPPVSLLLAVPGQLLAGDYRYAELAAVAGGAAFIGFSGPDLPAKLAACVLLTTPRGLFVLEQGWTEPTAILLLAATIFFMRRSAIAASWTAGLLIVSKQYLGLAGPGFLRFCVGRPMPWRLVLFAAFAASAATLPLALWHPNAFMNNVVWLQTREPFRIDSLSYLSWAARAGWGTGSIYWAVGAGLGALAIALVATPNTPAGFASTVALSSLVTFAFGSKAFCNYYFFVIGALCAGAAAAMPRASPVASAVAAHQRA